MRFTDLKICKRKLLTKSPFIAALLFKLECEIDNSEQNPTACTDGKKILFNENFLDSLSIEQGTTLLAHETMHVSLAHHLRMTNKNPDNWNIATDHAINLLLSKMGFKPLYGWLCDYQYVNLSAEQIYNKLPQNPSEQDKQSSQMGQFKEPDDMTDQEKNEAKQNAKEELQRAVDVQKKAQNAIANANIPDSEKENQLNEMGKALSQFEDVIKEFNQSQTDWREILQSFLNSFSYNDYNYSVANRHNSTEFYMPGLYQNEPGNITVALDVSGSTYRIAKDITNEVFNAMQILNEGDDVELNVIYCSDYIHADETITTPEQIRLIHGGGTSFKPVMDIMPNKNTEALIYITDGYCWEFGECPPQPVIWLLTENNIRFNPPFGEIAYIGK